MKKLTLTIIMISSLFLFNGCYTKKRLVKERAVSFDSGVAHANEIWEKKAGDAYSEGVQDGEYQAAKKYSEELEKLLIEAKTSIGKNISVSSEQSNYIFNTFSEVENGNPKSIEGVTTLIAQLTMDIVEKGLSQNKYKVTKSQKQKFYSLLKVKNYDISTQLRNDFLARVRKTDYKLTVQESLPVSISTSNTLKGNLIAQTITTGICSLAPLLIAALTSSIGIPISEPFDIVVGAIVKRPCEAVLIGIADAIATNVQGVGVSRDIEITTQNIRLNGRSLAELSTSSYSFSLPERLNLRNGNILEITFNIEAKAGVDFRNSFSLRRDDNSKTLFIRMPKAKLLNTNLSQTYIHLTLDSKDDITAQDLMNINKSAKKKGEVMALEKGLLKIADSNAKKFILIVFKPLAENPFAPYKIKFEN